jgi:deazaflavin-dependent oxidoreductase (nitroreductase family)
MAIPDGALKAIGKLNVPVYRITRGRLFGRLNRAPVLLLTTTGRRSGALRTAPVVYLVDAERMVVIDSNAGHARTPAWALNLRANADAEVEVRGARRPVTARVAEGEERGGLGRVARSACSCSSRASAAVQAATRDQSGGTIDIGSRS